MKKKSKKEEVKAVIREMFDAYLAKEGLNMSKKISSGSSGFFGYTSPTYDERKVYTEEDLKKLGKEGFHPSESIEYFIFNMFYTQL